MEEHVISDEQGGARKRQLGAFMDGPSGPHMDRQLAPVTVSIDTLLRLPETESNAADCMMMCHARIVFRH